MEPKIATPDEFFFLRSKKKKQPNFKEIKQKAAEDFVLSQDKKRGRQRIQAYENWLQRGSWNEFEINLGS